MQLALTINTLQSNSLPNYTTSRHLSRPPLQTFPTNPLLYSLNSTSPNNTQPTITDNNQLNTLNPSATFQQSNTSRRLQNTQFQMPNPPSATIRTNPHINATYTQPAITPPHLLSNAYNIPTYNTNLSSTINQPTISQPAFINSSTSISEPVNPFDGLDHNYTPEEYLQHIEARVTFSLGLQPTSDQEYKFWHGRRMAFIQCSLTGTALSWYIRLNDTYKHDWHAFVQAFKKQFSTLKNANYAQVEALNLAKKDNETLHHFALKVQQLV